MDETSLIREVLIGSGDAFKILVERYQDRIFRMVYNIVRDHPTAEDVAQEIFVKVYQKLKTFNFQSSFFTWLYRIALNTAMDHVKRSRRRRAFSLDDIDPLGRGVESTSTEAPGTKVDREETRAMVNKVLDTMPPKYRTVLILREYENLSYEEMSQVLHCSVGTVESRLFRARAKFKEKIRVYLKS